MSTGRGFAVTPGESGRTGELSQVYNLLQCRFDFGF